MKYAIPILAATLACVAVAAAETPSTAPAAATGHGTQPTTQLATATQPATTTQPATATQPTDAAKLAALAEKLPGIKVDVKNKTVDLDALVVTPDAKWLELLACTKGSREYEALMTVSARPTHIHLALLMIGMEPGAPMQWLNQGEGQPIKVVPASGAKMKVTLIYQKEGKEIQVPANEWVLDATTKKTLPDDIWLFAGSRMGEQGGNKMYYADASGAVLTLVNFGDDLLTRPNNNTNSDGNDHFAVNPAAIPPKDTKVIIRLQAAKGS